MLGALGIGACGERVQSRAPDEGGAVQPEAPAASEAPRAIESPPPVDNPPAIEDPPPVEDPPAADQEALEAKIEEMVPEVRPGNQTALRSRKHPFAKFITAIHRPIHERWAWGFLEELDTREDSHRLNDYDLWTRVEIVVLHDGTIESVTTVRPSGMPSFDAAAREVIHAAGPFPAPPPAIVSGNGKTYLHWALHRDERACGTFGAQPFILDDAGGGDRPDPSREARPVAGASPER